MTKHRTTFLIAIGYLLSSHVICPGARAADDTRPPFQLLRYDEDYSFLADPVQRTEFWDTLKYIPVAGGRAGFLSFGGEAREQIGRASCRERV